MGNHRWIRSAVLGVSALVVVACGSEGTNVPVPPPVIVVAPQLPPPNMPAPTAPPFIGPSWTDLVLPWAAPGWVVQPAQDHGQAQGYSVDYQHDGAGVRASIFVYDRGLLGIGRDPELLRAELREATAGVHRAREAGAYEAVRELPSSDTRLGAAPTAPFALVQPLIVTNGGIERQSTIYLTTHRAFFVKIRTTVQRGPSPAVDAAVSEMLTQIGAALRDPGPLGTSVTVDGSPVAPPSAPGCDVAACCASAQSAEPSVGLFCQLTAATGGPCAQQLIQVRTYLSERGTAIPAACQ